MQEGRGESVVARRDGWLLICTLVVDMLWKGWVGIWQMIGRCLCKRQMVYSVCWDREQSMLLNLTLMSIWMFGFIWSRYGRDSGWVWRMDLTLSYSTFATLDIGTSVQLEHLPNSPPTCLGKVERMRHVIHVCCPYFRIGLITFQMLWNRSRRMTWSEFTPHI